MSDETTERAHHPYSPSTLQNTEACPMFKSRQQVVVHERTTAGTKGHKAVEIEQDDESLSDEDALAVAECLDFVEQRRSLMQGAADAMLKQTFVAGCTDTSVVPLPSAFKVLELKESYLPIDDLKFDDCESTTAGYCDHSLINHDRTYAEMIDWKFGRWPVEEASNNLQGIAYSLGLFRMFPKLEMIRFWFRQPTIPFYTDHVFKRSDIPDLYLRVQVVVARARAARKANDYATAKAYSPICNFCDRLGDCPVVMKQALHIAKKFDPLEIPAEVTPEILMAPDQTSNCMKLASLMKIWSDAFKRTIAKRVDRGDAELPPGYEWKTSSGNRKIVNLEKFTEVTLRYISDSDLKKYARYGFGNIEELISDRTPRGGKQEAIEAYQKALEESGAVEKGEEFSYLQVAKVKNNE